MLVNKNVFVTGATGFIGASLVKRLISQGSNVFCLSRSSSSYNVNCTKLYVGDVCDYSLMTEIISTNDIEHIVHLAANAIVKNSARDPMNAYNTNVMGTVSLLEAARNVGKCKKIIIASSDKAYGDHENLPYTEDMPLLTRNTYDTSKACCDLIARTYAHNYNMNVLVTRCSNVYGPGDPNHSRIIPNTILRINNNISPMLYSDVAEMYREFVYIDDVIDAYELLLGSDATTNGEAFNIGGAGPIRVTNLVELVCQLMNVNLKTQIVQREITFKEIAKQYVDSSKLTSYTGWLQKTTLEDGLSKTIQWYKEILNNARKT